MGAVTLRGESCQVHGNRRWLLSIVAVLMLMGGMGWMAPADVAAGQAATVVSDGAPLFVDHDDYTVLDWMDEGSRVDVFYGPYNWMYEIRYDGTVGWTWAENIAVDGVGGGGSGGGGAATGGQNAWIDASAGLRVRNDASSNAGVIDVLDRGVQVWVTGNAVNGYVPMEYYGGSGWVAADYLSWDGNLSSSGGSSGDASGQGGGEHWIDINRSTGQVTLYVGNDAQYIFWGSLSRSSGDGFYATASGTYYVYAKNRSLTYSEFAHNYLSHWVGFDPDRHNGFHAYTKDANGNIIANGAGYTGGCVALGPGDIDVLFDFAFVGMRVEVHW